MYIQEGFVLSVTIYNLTHQLYIVSKTFDWGHTNFCPIFQKNYIFLRWSTQPVQKYEFFKYICKHSEDFGLEVELNFFATSHGKNACDWWGGDNKEVSHRGQFLEALLRPDTVSWRNVQILFHEYQGYFLCICACWRSWNKLIKLKQTFKTCKKIFRHIQSVTTTAHSVSILPDSQFKWFKANNSVLCMYDEKWWTGKVENISEENNDLTLSLIHI